jgi:hypothetical protein
MAAGCGKKTIDLTLHNAAEDPLSMSVGGAKKNGLPMPEAQLGTIPPNGKITKTFKRRPGESYIVKGALPGSAEVFEESRSVLKSDEKRSAQDIEVKPQIGTTLNLTSAQQTLANAFARLGPNRGFTLVQLNDALASRFGALIVVLPADTAVKGSEPQELFRLQPGRFSPRVAADEFQYPIDSDQRTVDITESLGSKMALSLPLLGALGLNPNSETVYKLSWNLTNFGPVEKRDPSNWDYIHGMAALDDTVRAHLVDILTSNPRAELLYANKMYVIGSAEFTYQLAKKLGIDAKADAGTIYSASAAWSYTSTTATTTKYQTSVLNMDGILLKPQLVRAPAGHPVPGGVLMSREHNILGGNATYLVLQPGESVAVPRSLSGDEKTSR